MARRIKVLLHIPNLQQGGAERQMAELYSRLPRDRYDPTLCVWEDVVHYKSYLRSDDRVHVLGVRRMGPRGLRELVRLIRTVKPDVLHSFRDKANVWARLATLWAPVPVVINRCGNQGIARAHCWLEPFLQRRSDRTVANSEGVRREWIERASVHPSRIQLIHNFIDATKFQPATAARRGAARTAFGIAEHELAFVLPGRISEQKNQLGLVEALGLLRQQNRLPSHATFLLAGRDRDRRIMTELPRRMERHSVTSVIRQLGNVPEHAMTDLYAAADVVLLPSRWEGLPNAVIEASFCARPTIVSAHANADRLVHDGVTGREVPTDDAPRLADAIVELARMSPTQRDGLGAAARAHVARMLDPNRVLRETLSLYETLLSRKRPELVEPYSCAG